MKIAKRVVCNLRHGVQLEITDKMGNLSAEQIADMLAFAMNRLKAVREISGDAPVDGSGFGKRLKDGGKILGSVNFFCAGKVLPATWWADAAIAAYVSANTVEQMQESLPEWKAASEKEGGYLREVVLLLEKGDVLEAITAMIDHDVKNKHG